MSVKQVIKRLKTKLSNGSLSDDIPIGADADNVFFEDGHTLKEVVGEIDIDTDGTIAEQLANGGGGNSPIRVVDTVNDMKQLTDLKAGDIVYTKGYSYVNDTGGARYLISNTQTSTDTGAMIGVNNRTQRATLFPETREVNVLQFGAGAASDATQAFQNAINYCQTNRCKLLINFSRSYLITAPIRVSQGITIEGINPASYGTETSKGNSIRIALESQPSNGGAFNIYVDTWSDILVNIKNLTIISDDEYSYPCFAIDNRPRTSQIQTYGVICGVTLEDICMKKFYTGVQLFGPGILLKGVKTYFNRSSKHIEMVTEVRKCLFENCTFSSNTTYADAGDIITVSADSAPAFINCDFDSRLNFSYLTNNPTKFFNCDNTISQPY